MNTKTETENKTEYEFKDIAVFNETNAALATMRLEFSNVPAAESTKDPLYETLKEGCRFLQKTRKAIETGRKEKTEEWRLMTKAVNDEGSRITEIIKELEEPWKEAKKALDEKAEREKAARIARLQAKIDELYNFVEQAKDQSSEEISNIIECVDAIDTTQDFFDLEKQAGEARLDILDKLGEMLSAAINFEQSEIQRKEAEDRAKEADRQAQLERTKAELESRINKLKMIPMDMFGKSSDDIKLEVDRVNQYEITEEQFFDRVDEAVQVKAQVVEQLNQMLTQAITLESVEAAKAEEQSQAVVEEPAEEIAQAPEKAPAKIKEVDSVALDSEHDKNLLFNYFNAMLDIELPELKTGNAQELVTGLRAEISELLTTYA